MYGTVFISHSKYDPNADFFHRVFSGLKTDSVWMEYEDIIPPPWETIRTNVNGSDAIFVLLSTPLLNQVHTNNWVSFEVGLAANSRKLLQPANLAGLDVYVFEPKDKQIEFPVPYCTHYMLYEKTDEEIRFLKEMIKEAPLEPDVEFITCPYDSNCGVTFYLLSNIESFACPACRGDISLSKPTSV